MSNYPFEAHQDIDNQRSGIYAIVNIKNGKFYIGSAFQLLKRMWLHKWHLNQGTHKNQHLQRSYNKHGKDYFVYKVVEYVPDKDKILEREQYYIDLYKPDGKLYNICAIAGSTQGVKQSKETIEKKKRSANQCKEVWQLNRHTYDVINIFPSTGEAERNVGIGTSEISAVCTGKKGYTRDYIWRYSN